MCAALPAQLYNQRFIEVLRLPMFAIAIFASKKMVTTYCKDHGRSVQKSNDCMYSISIDLLNNDIL